ncbi:MAG: hypothetical protein U1E67_23705 [Hyphomicrobiales bacterium]
MAGRFAHVPTIEENHTMRRFAPVEAYYDTVTAEVIKSKVMN